MQIREAATGREHSIIIEPVQEKDYKSITKKRYFFDWNSLATVSKIYKLQLKDSDDIKGLMSLIDHPQEQRIEIKLLAASIENVILKKQKGSKTKEYEEIAGNLIAFACKIALTKYGAMACVSLVPKTELKKHYIREYGMIDAGISLFLELDSLHQLIGRYKL